MKSERVRAELYIEGRKLSEIYFTSGDKDRDIIYKIFTDYGMWITTEEGNYLIFIPDNFNVHFPAVHPLKGDETLEWFFENIESSPEDCSFEMG